MSDPTDLQATVEQLRAGSYADIPADLVRTILDIEAAFIEDRAEATRRIRRAIEDHLAAGGTTPC